MIFVKRVYDESEESDGPRYLVDHLWPRGVKKEEAHLEEWIKSVSPSTQLCAWFSHDPEKWGEFQERYFAELDQKPASWEPLVKAAREGDFTLLYSAKDTEHNNAVALRMYLIGRIKDRNTRRRSATARQVEVRASRAA